MVIKNFIINLNKGDNTSRNKNLSYNLYGSLNDYKEPIAYINHINNNIIINNNNVLLENVNIGDNDKFKLTVIDEAGNESLKSPIFKGWILFKGFWDDENPWIDIQLWNDGN